MVILIVNFFLFFDAPSAKHFHSDTFNMPLVSEGIDPFCVSLRWYML